MSCLNILIGEDKKNTAKFFKKNIVKKQLSSFISLILQIAF